MAVVSCVFLAVKGKSEHGVTNRTGQQEKQERRNHYHYYRRDTFSLRIMYSVFQFLIGINIVHAVRYLAFVCFFFVFFNVKRAESAMRHWNVYFLE